MLHTHEIDDIADRFRLWLRKTDEELNDPHVVAVAEQLAHGTPDGSEDTDSVGLLQLVESLTAMRHDHKLHAKSLRQLHEDVQDSLTDMNHAARGLENARADARQAVEKASDDATESLLNAILDVNEALRQAITSNQRSMELSAHDTPSNDLLQDVQRMFQELPGWKRFFVRSIRDRLMARIQKANQSANLCGDETGTLEGLRLLQSRVRRALADRGVTPLACVGKRVDPRTMCVVDVVDDAQLPPETVVEEVRVGYVWQDKTIRIAEVRATKSQGSQLVQP
jgi:molecular chaperone GrpE (heat shock protein)